MASEHGGDDAGQFRENRPDMAFTSLRPAAEAPAGDISAAEVVPTTAGDNDVPGSDTPTPMGDDESALLQNLTATVRDQDDLERDITHAASVALNEAEDARDRKRIEKAEALRGRLEAQATALERKLRAPGINAYQERRAREELERVKKELEMVQAEVDGFEKRIEERHRDGAEGEDDGGAGAAGGRMPGESRREYLIRTGKITPFALVGNDGGGGGAGGIGARSQAQADGAAGELADVLIDAEDEAVAKELEDKFEAENAAGPRSHQILRLPGFNEEGSEEGEVREDDEGKEGGKGKKVKKEVELQDEQGAHAEFSLRPRKKRRVEKEVVQPDRSDDEFVPDEDVSAPGTPVDEDDDPSEDDSALVSRPRAARKRPATKKRTNATAAAGADADAEAADPDEHVDLSKIDDGDEANYRRRLADWVARRSRARRRRLEEKGDAAAVAADEADLRDEWLKPSPDSPDQPVGSEGLLLPGDIYPALFDYQKTGVQWLSELHAQAVGGIVGDEMGLGKTVQLISFVAALHHSGRLDKPVVVVAPATVLRQWVNEFHRWWPPLRVSIIHSSGAGMMNVGSEDRLEEQELAWDDRKRDAGRSRSTKLARRVVDRVVKNGHVLVTTYAGLETYGDVLIPVKWGYAVLDEGHKIRNPNTAVTIYCKELVTPNRIILSGTPMQNNLTELWSLFDFIYPMRLGTLVNFRTQFEIPIRLGGYANASNLQIMTAQKCAETLKDTISPYLLQRLKVDVASDLPKKSEQVLFCKLTREQRDAYEDFLNSDDMRAVLSHNRKAFFGIDMLRKICNHPDLTDPTLRGKVGYKWGQASRSGKMQVVKALVHMWKRFGHKTLLFSQGVQMLDILEHFVRGQDGINYLRMDGKTPVKDRQSLVDRFNSDPDMHLFLLTTKVGGLGVNLTGANRVIIFDPDWNPSTDMQARERAWRLGQKREVTIYRLMTAGTIEEKIYHRQIFKQFLTNKVLKDPKQNTTFNYSDLHDLFTLGPSTDEAKTETTQMFRVKEVDYDNGEREAGRSRPATQTNGTSAETNASESGGGGDGDSAVSVRAIAGVASLETYQQLEATRADAPATSSASGTSPSTSTPTPAESGLLPLPPARPVQLNDETRLMSGIFSRSSGLLHSAVEHDDVVNPGKKNKPQADRRMLQQEAARQAAQAALHLRRAEAAARATPIGTVTWTGEVGEAGRTDELQQLQPGGAGGVASPAARRRGGGGGGGAPSSAAILAGVSARQGLGSASGTTPTGSSRSGTPVGGRSANANNGSGTGVERLRRDFEAMIPAFVRRHGGSVPTKLLVDHFNQYCLDSRRAADAFKAALDRVAVLEKRGGALRGIWALKPGYQ